MSEKRNVPRHSINSKRVRDSYTSDKRILDIDIEYIQKHSSNLPGFFALAQRLACEAIVLVESPSSVTRYARLAAQLASASFKVGNPSVQLFSEGRQKCLTKFMTPSWGIVNGSNQTKTFGYRQRDLLRFEFARWLSERVTKNLKSTLSPITCQIFSATQLNE